MSELRKDYILRMVEQVSAFLQALLGLKSSGNYEEALREIDRVTGLFLGEDQEFISMLDTESAARFLVEPPSILAYAQLLMEKGDLLRQIGEAEEGAECEARALGLVIEAYRSDNACVGECGELLRRLTEREAVEFLSASQRELLAAMLAAADE